MTQERITPEDMKGAEKEPQHTPIVLRCIDFRTGKNTETWLKDQGLERGDYFLYASAGASGNPKGFIEAVQEHSPSSITAVDHQDCGFYKKVGDDSPSAHHHNLEVLGQNLNSENPKVEYDYHLLPVEDSRHTCTATAIILGEPEIVKLAREKLEDLGLGDDHDEIARPYGLSVDDETIWNDLAISIALHNPQKILLFEKDKENAQILMQKITEVADIHVEHVAIPSAA